MRNILKIIIMIICKMLQQKGNIAAKHGIIKY